VKKPHEMDHDEMLALGRENDAELRPTFPIQATARSHPSRRASVNRHVYLAAYEVYSHVFGPQQQLIEGECRGGFGTGELIAFLYARAFPRSEWSKRVDEALERMDPP
jgi:hypothetical protein